MLAGVFYFIFGYLLEFCPNKHHPFMLHLATSCKTWYYVPFLAFFANVEVNV
jgi:hypothetical protein